MLEVQNVYFSYGNEKFVLSGISLSIPRGENLAIIGENGAGKTTLIKHFNGLLRPSKGRVLLDGENLQKFSTAEICRKVGIVFQNSEKQFFCNTVWDEIAYGLKNLGYSSGQIREKVSRALELLDLSGYESRSPFSLSSGEKKRLALAVIIALDPDIIVLDEPTLGQDYEHRRKLIELLRYLLREGKTVVIATQDLEFVADFSSRVVVMKSGKILADGRVEDILSNRGLLEKANVLQPQIPQLSQKLGLKRVVNIQKFMSVLAEYTKT